MESQLGKQEKKRLRSGSFDLIRGGHDLQDRGGAVQDPLQMMSQVALWLFLKHGYEIGVPVSTIAMANLPIAVSRMVSESTLKRYRRCAWCIG